MRTAIKICDVSGIDILTVLQPSLNERTKRTTIEKKILRMSLEPHSSSDALTESYDTIRKSLASLPRTGNFSFLDCSRVFDAEKETVFTDIWHFSDFGHKILGQVMSEKIAEILKKRVKRGSAIRMKHSEQ
jgi:hypothetical protein